MKEEIEALKKDNGDLVTVRDGQRNRIKVIIRNRKEKIIFQLLSELSTSFFRDIKCFVSYRISRLMLTK